MPISGSLSIIEIKNSLVQDLDFHLKNSYVVMINIKNELYRFTMSS